ncbi:MAG: hypothetical protein R3C99_26655 [Pirellulaceae bacterium]
MARRGEELADLVEQLQSEAGEQSWEIERQIAQQAAAYHYRPKRLAAMSDAAEKLGDGKSGPAARQGRRAAEDPRGWPPGFVKCNRPSGKPSWRS